MECGLGLSHFAAYGTQATFRHNYRFVAGDTKCLLRLFLSVPGFGYPNLCCNTLVQTILLPG